MLLSCLGENVLSDDFRVKSEKEPFPSRKLKYLTKVVVLMKRKMDQCVVSGSFEAGIIQISQRENTSFAIRPQFSGSQMHVSLQIQRCVKPHLGHCTIQWENVSGDSVLCFLPYLLLPWLGDSVQSDSLPTRSGKQHVSSGKLKNLTKTVAVMKRKMNPCVFLAGLRLELSSL